MHNLEQGLPNFLQMAPFKKLKKPLPPSTDYSKTPLTLFCSLSATWEYLA